MAICTLQNSKAKQVKTVLYYSGHIIAAYLAQSTVAIFKVGGPLQETIELQDLLQGYPIQGVDHIMVPRLDWQDREFDTIQRAQKVLPRKICFAGEYNNKGRMMPFIMMYDREQPAKKTVARVYKSKGRITCMMYGPYDNGHILVGLSTGDFFAFETMTLKKLCNIKLSDCPITQITIEPTQLVLVGVSHTQEVTALTFIQTKQQYIYMEIGSRKYATVVLSKE